MPASDAAHDVSFYRLVTCDGIRQNFVAGFYPGRVELRRGVGSQFVLRSLNCAATVAVANRRVLIGVSMSPHDAVTECVRRIGVAPPARRRTQPGDAVAGPV